MDVHASHSSQRAKLISHMRPVSRAAVACIGTVLFCIWWPHRLPVASSTHKAVEHAEPLRRLPHALGGDAPALQLTIVDPPPAPVPVLNTKRCVSGCADECSASSWAVHCQHCHCAGCGFCGAAPPPPSVVLPPLPLGRQHHEPTGTSDGKQIDSRIGRTDARPSDGGEDPFANTDDDSVFLADSRPPPSDAPPVPEPAHSSSRVGSRSVSDGSKRNRRDDSRGRGEQRGGRGKQHGRGSGAVSSATRASSGTHGAVLRHRNGTASTLDGPRSPKERERRAGAARRGILGGKPDDSVRGGAALDGISSTGRGPGTEGGALASGVPGGHRSAAGPVGSEPALSAPVEAREMMLLRRRVAVGVLTHSKASPKYASLEETWLPLFEQVVVFESHTDVSRVQQIWKYVPQRLYMRFPHASWYLIIDDDVFINQRRLLDFIATRNPNELALYGPGFCDWGVKASLKEKIATAISDVTLPQFIHIVIGGIMLFTSAAVKQFSDATMLMRCIDDLATLYSNDILLWDGLKTNAMYNQDWLFCWCLQVRLKGTVYLDNAFEDIDFPAQKCLTLADVVTQHVGIHHVAPRRMRALWRAYERVGARVDAAAHNASTSALAGWDPRSNLAASEAHDPSQAQQCQMGRHGDPYHHLPWKERRRVDTLPKPVAAGRCKSILDDPALAERYPHCIPHMRYVQAHSTTSPCAGRWGRHFCEGFQLDRTDDCNVQYYLFCERIYKIKSSGLKRGTWCPSPEGYPKHCCYGSAVAAPGVIPAKRQRQPSAYLLQVFPDRPS